IDHVDLDVSCVLYGLIEMTPFDMTSIAGIQVPRAVVVLGAVLLIDLLAVLRLFKDLKISSFDPFLATVMGINATLIHYGLISAVAATTVAAFESVGSILVVAMLIAPGAAAHLLTDRLGPMLWIAAAVAALSAMLGVVFAVWLDTSISGMMAVWVGILFGGAVLLSPRHGFISRQLRQWALSMRILREDVLGMLYRWEESKPAAPLSALHVRSALRGGFLARLAMRSLGRSGAVAPATNGGLKLTPAGQSRARQLVRSHRLWETYLAENRGLPLDHLHDPATRMEHFVSEGLGDRLAEDLQADKDPHGREIPRN
ncbi:MAG: metal ABC transporter permease, partial [Phycisphaerae bacterium]